MSQVKPEKFKYLMPMILSAALTYIILMLVFIKYGLYPFGKNTISWCDMDQQLTPILASIKNGNWEFNWGNAGGMSFLGVIFYYVFSPFSAIVAFFDTSDIMVAENIIVLLKIVMSAVTASVFFKKFFPKLEPAVIASLSTMYALCGYSLMLFQILSWLDTMYLFPLLLITMKIMYDTGNAVPYSLCLSAIMITCFYLSWSVCLFIIFASGIYLMIFGEKNRGRYTLSLISGSVCSLLISMPVLVPSFLLYMKSARGGNMIDTFINGVSNDPLETKLSFVLCTAIVLPSLIFLLKKVGSGRDKRVKLLLVLFAILLLPVFVEKINTAWHIFSYQAFPYRYGYMTSLMMLAISAEALEESGEEETGTKGKMLSRILFGVTASAICAAGVIFAYRMLNKHLKTLAKYTSSLWADAKSLKGLGIAFLLFAVLYTVIICLKKSKKLPAVVFSVLLVLVTVGECFFNSGVYIGSASNTDTKYRKSIKSVEAIEDVGDDFYRVKYDSKLFDVNWIGATGTSSLGHYTSLTDEDYLFGMRKLGYSGYWMEIGSQGSTVFMDSLLCNKYTLQNSSKETFAIQENRYYMPLGVFSEGDITDLERLDGSERIGYQNEIYSLIFGKDDGLFVKYEPTELRETKIAYVNGEISLKRLKNTSDTKILYTIDVEGAQTLYFDAFYKPSTKLTEKINGAFTVLVNGKQIVSDFPTKAQNGIIRLGEFKDEQVSVEIRTTKDTLLTSFGVWGLDNSKLSKLKGEATFASLSVNGTRVNGSITADKDGYLFLAIPYSEGFSATVNSKKAEIYRVFECFTAIRVEKGENTIKLKYSTPGLGIGIAFGIVGVILLIAFALFVSPRIRETGNGTLLSKAANVVFYIGFAVFVIIIYVAPLIISVRLFLKSY